MSPSRSLLELLQGLIERTYRMRTGVEVDRFVIGDRGLMRTAGASGAVRKVGSAGWPEAALLVRQERGEVRAALYYPDALIACLERSNPLRGLDDSNVDAFGVFVEEL